MRLSLSLAACLCVAAGQAAAEGGAPESYALDQGAVIQCGSKPRAFLSAPSGGIEAVDALSGKRLWASSKAAFPLLARGERLLVQLQPKGSQGCGLALLDARSGRILKKIAWPGKGSPGCIGEGISGSFQLEAFSHEGRDYLVAVSRWHPVPGGANRGDRLAEPGSSGENKSYYEFDFASAELSPLGQAVPGQRVASTPSPGGGYHSETFALDGVSIQAAVENQGGQWRPLLRRWKGGESLPDIVLGDCPFNSCGVVFSADRALALGVHQVPGKRDPFLYHLIAYDAASGLKLAELDSSSWPSAAQACGRRLLAYFPWRLFCLDMDSGKELWSRPIKDIRYRGSYPP